MHCSKRRRGSELIRARPQNKQDPRRAFGGRPLRQHRSSAAVRTDDRARPPPRESKISKIALLQGEEGATFGRWTPSLESCRTPPSGANRFRKNGHLVERNERRGPPRSPEGENSILSEDCLVRSRRLELPRAFAHNDLNVARLPIPPRPHVDKGCVRRPRQVGAGP